MAGEEAATPISVQEPGKPELHETTVVVVGDAEKQATTTTADATAMASRLQHLSLSAQTIHADDYLNSHQSVAPPMHVSTTFRYNRDPDELRPWVNVNVCFWYSLYCSDIYI